MRLLTYLRILLKAVSRGRGFLATFCKDTDSVYEILTAKRIRPDIMAVKQIRAESPRIRQNLDFIVVARKKKNGIIRFNPNSESVIEAGDGLSVIGATKSPRRVEKIPA